jgi:hypothetical protein
MMTEAEVLELINKKIKKEFKGTLTELEGAIGMLFVGRQLGWKPLMLMHDRKTIAKYEKILGIEVEDEFPPVGDYAMRSFAWRVFQKGKEKMSSFWKAVKGEVSGIRSGMIQSARG